MQQSPFNPSQLAARLRRRLEAEAPATRRRLRDLADLIRLDRPIGWLLLLWPTLWALWIAAEGVPDPHLLLVFVLGVFLTRSAGCAVNDYADREFDPQVRRTRERPLAAGRLPAAAALRTAAVLFLLAFLLVLTTNMLTVLLAFLALPVACLYPYMKRHTYIPQVVLGVAYSWGILMAFAAQTRGVPQIAWLLFLANVLWVLVFDTIYAMVDRDDDIRIGVKSTAILFAESDRLIIGILQLMLTGMLALVGLRLDAGMWYWAGLAAGAALLAWHQVLIFDRTPQRCFRAFLHNNWFGLAIFAGIAADYAVKQ
jgi:4-hydroxybenzoate polyprenyltransferase